ncbi:MAG TPA: hypothetical protein DEP53_06480 [Bacteroidetes bacterium]|nr:hypothetical protein [Bacteroidota bacterium]
MYDETIHRSARRQGIVPINFTHPYQDQVIQCFSQNMMTPVSVILTGTAGDGKTHLCRQVWNLLKGEDDKWVSDNPYLTLRYHLTSSGSDAQNLKRAITVHFIRDLSGWAPQHGAKWEPEKEQLLLRFCHSLFNPDIDEVFLIAANDGQLIESFRRLKETEEVKNARKVFEDLLVTDRQEQPGIRLKFFNLSRSSSAELFDRAIEAFLTHHCWADLKQGMTGENELFGPKCPIRYNYELLQTPLVKLRIRSLLELCDYNGLHVPIRQILLLLTNAVLGHPDVKDHLMVPNDVPEVIAAGTTSKASLYNNVFGGNLSEIRRQAITIFDYLDRFQIGYETSNRVDNILIFGEGDENLGSYFDNLIANDHFYGADSRFYAAKKEYIEGTDTSEEKSEGFLQMLVNQRRGLFFKISKEMEFDLKLWELTVFKFAGEYLDSVVEVLKKGAIVKRPILSQLVRGLNRVFTGMLINSDRELFLASSGNYSQAKVSRILVERVSVEPSKGEKVILRHDFSNGQVLLSVFFSPDIYVDFSLTLIRFEYLSRIALEGALPASFSKECYEDLLAFKSCLIAAYMRRQEKETGPSGTTIGLNVLALTEQGMPDPIFVEITP